MLNVLKKRSAIYDQFHGSSAGPDFFFLDANTDVYAAYYTSMFLIQDTGQAIAHHIDRGFSTNPMDAYLEFWGVMQAIVIQQDAIKELHKAVVGCSPQIDSGSSWQRLCLIRNLCAGHPAKRTHGVPAPQRTFMGRDFGTYDCIKYELWDEDTWQTTHPTFNLRQMIGDYDREASAVLDSVLITMASKWPRV